MNITNSQAGYATQDHILSKGFSIFDTIVGSDMGMSWELPQYKNEEMQILGGYWNYVIKDNEGNTLWEGWWNSNEEFDDTIAEIKNLKDNDN